MGRDIQKYYLEPKKIEISGSFLWSKSFLDKGIANRIIGQRAYALIFRNKRQTNTIKKGPGKLSSIGRDALLATVYWLLRMDLDSTWHHAHHCAFDEVFACARAVCNSASTYLVVCRLNPSTYRGLAFCALLRWGLVRGRCESVGVGIQRSYVRRRQ